MKPPYQPSIGIRLFCWFGIYFTASCFGMWGIAIKGLPGEPSVNIFWLSTLRIVGDLRLLIVGSLDLPYYGIYSHLALLFAYGCFLLDLALCFILRNKRAFWILIVFLGLLIFLSFLGSSIYVENVFEVIPTVHTL